MEYQKYKHAFPMGFDPVNMGGWLLMILTPVFTVRYSQNVTAEKSSSYLNQENCFNTLKIGDAITNDSLPLHYYNPLNRTDNLDSHSMHSIAILGFVALNSIQITHYHLCHFTSAITLL